MISPAIECTNLQPRDYHVSTAEPHGLNLAIQPQSLTCIVGPCDSGKTVYSRLIGGVDKPANGNLSILGHNIWNLEKPEWEALRLRASYVLPGNTLLSSLSAFDNVLLPAKYHSHHKLTTKQIEKRADEILEWLNFHSDYQQLPGYLSDYHKRLLTIARSLILEPEILFIDEAFAHLDAPSRENIAQCYKDMQNELQMTLVLATHDLVFASEHADILVFMHPTKPKIFNDWQMALDDQDPYIQNFISANFK